MEIFDLLATYRVIPIITIEDPAQALPLQGEA